MREVRGPEDGGLLHGEIVDLLDDGDALTAAFVGAIGDLAERAQGSLLD